MIGGQLEPASGVPRLLSPAVKKSNRAWRISCLFGNWAVGTGMSQRICPSLTRPARVSSSSAVSVPGASSRGNTSMSAVPSVRAGYGHARAIICGARRVRTGTSITCARRCGWWKSGSRRARPAVSRSGRGPWRVCPGPRFRFRVSARRIIAGRPISWVSPVGRSGRGSSRNWNTARGCVIR